MISGDGDIADICRLTCLEQNIIIVDGYPETSMNDIPTLEVRGAKIILHMEM
jgi:hypothetical protein